VETNPQKFQQSFIYRYRLEISGKIADIKEVKINKLIPKPPRRIRDNGASEILQTFLSKTANFTSVRLKK